MAVENVNYEAVLADLLERRSQIDAAIEAIRQILKGLGASVNGTQKITSFRDIPSDAFFTLSIVDATKKYLGMAKSKQSTEVIRQALEHGGLPPIKYNSVYTLLRRRERTVGDIVRVGDDWGLAEWYPNSPALKRRAKTPGKASETNGEKTETPTPQETEGVSAPPPRRREGPTLYDLCEQVISDHHKPMHVTEIAEKLAEQGRPTTVKSVSGTLRQDPQQRFRNYGKNIWGLVAWSV